MKSSAHFRGHPIHPALVAFPTAYLAGAAAIDLYGAVTGRRGWARTAGHLGTLGLATAGAAALPGMIDYIFAVPPHSSAKERATNHMLANTAAVALFAVARRGRRRFGHPRLWAVAAELAGTGLLTMAGWMGGTLVYRNQIGVDHRYAGAGKYRTIAVPDGDPRFERVDIGAVELDEGQMILVRAAGRRVVVARTSDGLTAFDDRCPHKGGPLSDGSLACGVVHCPWHGSQFDVRTGAAVAGPAESTIDVYQVRERGRNVLIGPVTGSAS
jgi:nitrite reductase/ring-hydroxylating ferredoxin subunit/uncharacterized membrane protein